RLLFFPRNGLNTGAPIADHLFDRLLAAFRYARCSTNVLEENQLMSETNSKRLSITRAQLDKAGTASGITPEQTAKIWTELASAQPAVSPTRQFGAAQVAWYMGAAVVLVAMGWLMAQVATTYGNLAMTALSLAYTGLFLFTGSKLTKQEGLRVPGGLLYTL